MATFSKHLDVALQVARIKRSLDSVVKQVEKDIKPVVKANAEAIAAEMRSLAPVDSTSATPGALKASIRVEERPPTAKAVFRFAIKAGDKTTQRPLKGRKGYFDYARVVEFGSVDQPAQSFFWPIWRARRKSVKAAVRKTVKAAVITTFKGMS